MLLALVLLHGYIWWRMVRSTTVPGRTRRRLTLLTVVLALLPAAAVGLRRTLPPDAAGTFPRYREPGARTPRLDWILYGGPVRVLDARVLAERPRGVWASDHFPVRAELEHDGGPAS